MSSHSWALHWFCRPSLHVSPDDWGRITKEVLKSLTLKVSGMCCDFKLNGESVMARAAAKAAARGAGRQVLGYATLGAAIIADVPSTLWRRTYGRFRPLLIHPWGTSAFQAGSGFLLEPEIGRCTAGTWVVATADGHVDDEVRFITLISTVKYTMRILD